MKVTSVLLFALERPVFFNINSVDDYFIFFEGYRIGKEGAEGKLSEFSEGFSEYLRKIYNFNNVDSHEVKSQFKWNRYIRFFSSNDSHSLELLREHLLFYVEENNIEF